MIREKILANLMGQRVKDDPLHIEPRIGQRVEIIDYRWFTSNEAVRVSKMTDLCVAEVYPIVISDEDCNHHWEYEIYTNFDRILIPVGAYKLLPDKEEIARQIPKSDLKYFQKKK